MNTLAGIIFFISGMNNGVDVTAGFGFTDRQDIFLNPVGILEVKTPIYQHKNLRFDLGGTHNTSVPDAHDNGLDYPGYNPKNTGLNMVSITVTVSIR